MIKFISCYGTQWFINYVKHVGILFLGPALVRLSVFDAFKTAVLAAFLLFAIQLLLLCLHLCQNYFLFFLNLFGNKSHIKQSIALAHSRILYAWWWLQVSSLLIGRLWLWGRWCSVHEIIKGLELSLLRGGPGSWTFLSQISDLHKLWLLGVGCSH